MHPTRVLFAEYLALPDDGMRYEVLEGELIKSPAPGRRHQRVSGNIHSALDRWRESNAPEGEVLAAPFDVVLAEDTIVQPDLIYVRPERRALYVDERLHGAPDLAVEIFHSRGASRDRVAKLQLYARYQIPEYWLVDLDARTLTIMTHTGTGYAVFAGGSGDTPLESKHLEGLRIVPSRIFTGI